MNGVYRALKSLSREKSAKIGPKIVKNFFGIFNISNKYSNKMEIPGGKVAHLLVEQDGITLFNGFYGYIGLNGEINAKNDQNRQNLHL